MTLLTVVVVYHCCVLLVELCLAEPMVELNVHAVVLRTTETDLCDVPHFQEFLQKQIMSNYRQPENNGESQSDCHIQGLTQISCRENCKFIEFL